MIPPVRRANVVFGLWMIGAGLFYGAFMSAAVDFRWIDDWLSFPVTRHNDIQNAHAHLGVIGLANIALGFILPITVLGRRAAAAVSWTGIAAGLLVPAGMTLHAAFGEDRWATFKYVQIAGFLCLTVATFVAAWGLRRPLVQGG